MKQGAAAAVKFRPRRFQNPVKGFVPIPGKKPKVCGSALEAVQCVKSGNRVFLHCCAASPIALIDALGQRASELRGVEFTGSLMRYTSPLSRKDPNIQKAFIPNLFFIGQDEHKLMKQKYPYCQYVPICLQEAPSLFESPDFPIDVAFLSLSPPDKHGWCSLNASVTVGKSGANAAKTVVAEISPHFPRTHGDTFVHYSHLDYVFHSNRKLIECEKTKVTETHRAIGKYIAELIPDGACLQMGIGAVPDAILASLGNHKDLGIHTEMFADGVLPLLEKGVINNSKKGSYIGKVLGNFVFGTEQLYRYIDDNPLFHFESAQVTNDPQLIARNPKMYAINSAMQVDLTGQICADTHGFHEYSGVGGQLDFVRGASLSEGGRAIIALPATAKNGTVSRIVASLPRGASVTTDRWHGATIVTEFGVADLWGLNTRQRAQALINIAHPRFREELDKFAFEVYGRDK